MSYTEPPPPPSGPYGGEQPAYGGGQPATTSGKAIASMVTGLVGLLTVCCGFLVVSSVVGLVLGILARKDIARSGGRLTGNGLALTGIISGAVGLALFVLALILVATGTVDYNFDYSTS